LAESVSALLVTSLVASIIILELEVQRSLIFQAASIVHTLRLHEDVLAVVGFGVIKEDADGVDELSDTNHHVTQTLSVSHVIFIDTVVEFVYQGAAFVQAEIDNEGVAGFDVSGATSVATLKEVDNLTSVAHVFSFTSSHTVTK
jgi:hypothetical protein